MAAADTTLAMERYDSLAAAGPTHTAWSARRTWRASLSASECTATVSMPSSRQARITRTAISPRLAVKTFLNRNAFAPWNTQVLSTRPAVPRFVPDREPSELVFARRVGPDAPGLRIVL